MGKNAPYNLSWDGHRTGLRPVASLYGDESVVDVTIFMKGETFEAYKSLCSASTTYSKTTPEVSYCVYFSCSLHVAN